MKQKIKKYGFWKFVSVLVIVLSALMICAYGTVSLFAKRQMDASQMPQLGNQCYIAITDEQFSDKVDLNAMVFGKARDTYYVGDVVAVKLTASDMVKVVPNTCGDIAVVQVVALSETTFAVAYNDISVPFSVGEDAVLCGIDMQMSYLGYVMTLMLIPMSFLFFLVLPILLIVLFIVVLAYLKEKTLRSGVEYQRYLTDTEEEKVEAKVPLTKTEEKPVEPAKGDHPLLSGKEDEMVFPKLVDNNDLAEQIAKKIAMISAQEQKDRETLSEGEKLAWNIPPVESTRVLRAAEPTGSVPAQPKTTVVYQVGEQLAQVKQPEPEVTEDDIDLMLLQDKIENIIHNNNRRLEDEVEQKLRGLGTEKEKAQRELEKTREFFISPAHLNQHKK